MRFVILTALVILSAAKDLLFAQGVPSTDIFLAPLSTEHGRLTVGAPVNATNWPGYDNQPSFISHGKRMVYTSIRDDGQADIYYVDFIDRQMGRVTSTPESEYSPTEMPGGRRLSVIRVEKDSTQRLWSFALDGTDPHLVVASLKPVGYHVWLDDNTLAMFVLGSPNALVIGDLRTGKMDTVARAVGRSLARLPDGSGFSFTQVVDSTTRLRGMDPATKRTWEITTLPRGVQDLVWLSDGTLLVGSGSKLLSWKKGATAWTEVADLASAGLTQITRLAVRPGDSQLAIVAVPK